MDSGFEMPENAVQITSVVDGFLWISYVVIAAIRNLGAAGLGVLAAIIAACFWLYRRNTLAWERAAGAEDDETTAQQG